MSEAEIAWAAGLFEGEGNVALTQSGIQIRLSMCDEDVVRRWGAVVGVGKCYGPYTRKVSPKPHWLWRISSTEEIIALFEAFRPWLGQRRIEQFERTIAHRLSVPRGLPPGEECGFYSEPIACARGYSAHLRRRESACATCRKSMWLYQKARRAARTIGT